MERPGFDPLLEREYIALGARADARPRARREGLRFRGSQKKRIAKNKLPERLVVVPEMPLTPTRKIIKGRLRIP